jgi:hypothetical protein
MIIAQQFRRVSQCSFRISLFMLIVAYGCNSSTPEAESEPLPESPPASSSLSEPESPPEIPSVDVDSMTFESKGIEALFQAFNGSARRFTDASWRHSPYQNILSHGYIYKAEWSLHPPANDPRSGIMFGPNQYIQVGLSPGVAVEDPNHIKRSSTILINMPEKGMGCRCDYGRADIPARDTFEITFYQRSGPDNVESLIRFPGAMCGAHQEIREYTYHCSTRISPPPKGEELARNYFESPESFLETALSGLDELETIVRRQYEDGTLIRESHVPHNWDGSRGAPPDLGFNPDPATEPEREELRDLALDDIERQRRLLRSQYQEMHAALTWYPILDCLDEAARIAEE